MQATTHTSTVAACRTNATFYSKHRTHYLAAMAFIQSHGHFAAITKDGLLALSWEGNSRTTDGYWDSDTLALHGADCWYEAPMLFEVDEDGMVASRDVREWLGY
ncbi:hypothetical protein [Mesorhizobium sp. WSM4982]|uniref:hypothetical protein n=1 Tax=Mesorhizobium sp. WSM4982 TaxID=3038550 RepID=UPI0024150B81|nr:hypothetical protein [Mesorhizobium sp. WSM4982]MDG4856440.1 hypothetical protein [Mesorhizobium sp. WSM4982]